MVRYLAMIAALAPLPAWAEAFDCQISAGCTTIENACSERTWVLVLTIADDGQTATLEAGGQTLEMSRIDAGATGRSFLGIRADKGVGVLTLLDDGSLVASSNEFDGPPLIGVTSAGTCTPRTS